MCQSKVRDDRSLIFSTTANCDIIKIWLASFFLKAILIYMYTISPKVCWSTRCTTLTTVNKFGLSSSYIHRFTKKILPFAAEKHQSSHHPPSLGQQGCLHHWLDFHQIWISQHRFEFLLCCNRRPLAFLAGYSSWFWSAPHFHLGLLLWGWCVHFPWSLLFCLNHPWSLLNR